MVAVCPWINASSIAICPSDDNWRHSCRGGGEDLPMLLQKLAKSLDTNSEHGTHQNSFHKPSFPEFPAMTIAKKIAYIANEVLLIVL